MYALIDDRLLKAQHACALKGLDDGGAGLGGLGLELGLGLKAWMTAARAWAVVMARVGFPEVRGKGEDEGHVPRGRCVRLPQDAKLLSGYSPGCEGEGEEKGDGAGEEKGVEVRVRVGVMAMLVGVGVVASAGRLSSSMSSGSGGTGTSTMMASSSGLSTTLGSVRAGACT